MDNINPKSNEYCAIIVAAGVGSRMMSDIPKQYINLGSQWVLCYTIEAFERFEPVTSIVLVTAKDYVDEVNKMCTHKGYKKVKSVVCGGDTRQESVYNGLLKVPKSSNAVLIHDGARPLIDEDSLYKCIEHLKKGENCALGVKVKDTLKLCDEDLNILSTPNRDNMYHIMTPQCFLKEDILNAHISAREKSYPATDDCMLLERLGKKVKIVEGNGENIKITTPEDLILARIILEKRGLM